MPLLEVQNLSLQFNGKTVLNDISFTLNRGYLFAAVGYLIMVTLLTLLARKIQHSTRIPGFA